MKGEKLYMHRSNRLKISFGSRVFNSFNVLLMIIFCISILYPFWDMIVTSLTSAKAADSLRFRLWPTVFSLDSYKFVLSDGTILSAALVTIYRAVVGTLIHVFIIVCAAYPLSKLNLPHRKSITMFFIIPMFFSGGLIPSYIINKNLGLVNSLLVYVVPCAFSAFTMILVRNYFISIDPALEESALIDGASVIKIITKIILPVSKPIIATIVLWHMVFQWNSWFDSLIYMQDETKIVLQLIMRRMIDNTSEMSAQMQMYANSHPGFVNYNSRSIQAAITMVVVTPIICVYPFLQKYFIKGIMLGSVKG